MMTRTGSFVVGLIVAISPLCAGGQTRITPEDGRPSGRISQPADLPMSLADLAQRRTDFQERVGAALRRGDETAAMEAAERLAEVERQICETEAAGEDEQSLVGGVRRDLLDTLQWLATRYEQANLDKAELAWDELARRAAALPSSFAWRARTAEIELDRVRQLRRFTSAQRAQAREAAELYRHSEQLRHRGESRDAVAVAVEAFRIDSRLFTSESLRIVAGRLSLANAYLDAALPVEAQRTLAAGMSIVRERLGPTHPIGISYQRGLGAALREQGRPREALPLFEEALAEAQRLFDAHHYQVAKCQHELAGAYLDCGLYAKALPIEEAAAESFRRGGAADVRDAAAALNRLAQIHRRLAHFDAAQQLLDQSAGLLREHVGEMSTDFAMALNNLGEFAMERGDYKNADRSVAEALRILAETGGRDRPEYALVLATAGRLAQASGQRDRGQALLRESLDILSEAVGEKHPEYLRALVTLGELYATGGQSELAEVALREALDILPPLIGQRHPEVARVMKDLGELYLATQRPELALRLLTEACGILAETVGPTHPDYLVAARQRDRAGELVRQAARPPKNR